MLNYPTIISIWRWTVSLVSSLLYEKFDMKLRRNIILALITNVFSFVFYHVFPYRNYLFYPIYKVFVTWNLVEIGWSKNICAYRNLNNNNK